MAYILKDGKISKEKLHISQDKIKQLLLSKKNKKIETIDINIKRVIVS